VDTKKAGASDDTPTGSLVRAWQENGGHRIFSNKQNNACLNFRMYPPLCLTRVLHKADLIYFEGCPSMFLFYQNHFFCPLSFPQYKKPEFTPLFLIREV